MFESGVFDLSPQKLLPKSAMNLSDFKLQVKSNLTTPTNFSPAIAGPRSQMPPRVIGRLAKILAGRKYRLLPAEVLHIVNHRPTNRDELSGLVEEAEERYSEAQQDEILLIVKKCFEKAKVYHEGNWIDGRRNIEAMETT